MRADILALLILLLYLAAYLFYSRFLAEKVFKLNDKKKTPAHKFQDGIDFVPARKTILFGHHFASIAGAAPIVGPCIAVYWGWLPALAWVVLGNIFMGAVHDMGTLFLSVRHKAESIASVAGDLINKKSRVLFLFLVLFLIWIVSAAFSVVIAKLFVAYPASVIPTNAAIFLALILGYLLYVKKINALVPSVIALVLLYALIPLGQKFPIDLMQIFAVEKETALGIWVIFLLAYGYVASVLPVWVLLQPRDYINSHQLVVALVILLVAIFYVHPEIVAPMINIHDTASEDAMPIFPFLFTTIACGAISGAHGLVSSGTTAKQVNKETDIRGIAYGSMLIEGALALLAIIAASAGFKNSLDWHAHYNSWTYASKHGLNAFIEGSASFLAQMSVDHNLAATFIAVIVIGFAATTLDTLFRIQRFIVAEIAENFSAKKIFFWQKENPLWKIFSNRYFGSAIAVVSVLFLVFSNGGENLSGAFTLWPLFGTANQLLAALALLLISLFLFKKKNKFYWLTLVPAIFMLLLTFISNFLGIVDFWAQSNWTLSIISMLLLLLQVLLCIEAVQKFSSLRGAK